jgi:HD-GYP domain-containing protein (c-di-GMP phosphodiesterase class II)
VFREGTALEALESGDSRRFLPHAVAATLLVIVAPAVVVVALSPLSGILDLLLSALLATGLSVAAGSAGSALWTRLPQAREIPFGDLMLWAWARRVRAERRLARVAAGGAPLGPEGELAGLRTLAVVYEARDGFSHGHSGRVARHAERIARRLGLPDAEVERIEAAASVHDVGLLDVPSSVLCKDDLSHEERGLVERHAVDGADRVAAIADPEIAALVRHHHERVDGGGYPEGLVGEQIPLGARIIAVADRFDELLSAAPQSAPRGRRNALDELRARAGTELDASIVAAFVGYYSGARAIAGVALAATAPQRALRWIAAAPATIGSAGAPVVVQGFCAAGTVALASACLGGFPGTTPERDDRPAAHRPAERSPAVDGVAARRLAGTDPAGVVGRGEPPRRRDRSSGRDEDRAAPRPGAPQGPSGGGGPDRPGGTMSPAAPPAGGGGGHTPPATGGEDSQAPAPAAPAPAQPTAPVQPPLQVELPPAPTDPTSRVLDPVLDGVSEIVPQAAPITDAVKGLVGGLAGGLTGGHR